MRMFTWAVRALRNMMCWRCSSKISAGQRTSVAVHRRQAGRIEEARAGYARALALAQQLGDRSAERAETHELAVLDSQQGRIEEARAGYARALALAQQLGDRSAERAETHALAVLDAQQGRIEEARAGFARALALAQQLGDRSAEQAETHELAVLDFQQGRIEEARAGYRGRWRWRSSWDRSAEQAGATPTVRRARAELSALDARNGDSTAATELRIGDFLVAMARATMIDESLEICERLGDIYRVALMSIAVLLDR